MNGNMKLGENGSGTLYRIRLQKTAKGIGEE
jgi:hypothetical protein